MPGLLRVGVLASGGGTNLQALLEGVHEREARIVAVATDQPDALALERARIAAVPAATFPRGAYPHRVARDAAIGDWLEAQGVELVVLAGYMAILDGAFIARFRDRIINVHPSLLPAFPGLDAIGQALRAGAKSTGVTVHFVDEGVDTGPALVQREVPIPASRDRAELEAAVHAVEHELYPEAIRMIARGRVRIDAADQRVVIVDE